MAEHDIEKGTKESPTAAVSRRDFLKLAGIAGATIGAGAGLGGLLSACGGDTTTTTAAAATTTTAAAGSSTTGATTATTGAPTTVTSTAEMGPEVKVGVITPLTGAYAQFGAADKYNIDRTKEFVGDGLVLGDKKKHPITFSVQDCQSDVTRAGQVTSSLVSDNVQIIIGLGSDLNLGIADICEASEMPSFTCDFPWQAWVFGRKGAMDKAWKWTYFAGMTLGLEDITAGYTKVWNKFPNNKQMGVMFSNDSTGMAFDELLPPAAEAAGFTLTESQLYQAGQEDYTAEISKFKKAGCEVFTMLATATDFANFWKQCHQQGWVPKIATVDKGPMFPEAIEALGAPPNGVGICSGYNWGPLLPYKLSYTGETCQQFADEFEKRTGKQWTQPLGQMVPLEMAIWSLQHATDPTDRESIIATVKDMKFDTIGGPIDFSAPVAQPAPGIGHVHPNVYKTAWFAAQWQEGTKHPYDYWIVDNTSAPNIPVQKEQIPVPGATS